MRRFYETIFIIDPTSDDAVVEQTIDSATNLIQSSGYVVREIDRWGKKRLAYEIKKRREGIYVLMVFEAEPDFVAQLQRHYQLSDDIIKYMVVKFAGDTDQLSSEQVIPSQTTQVAEEKTLSEVEEPEVVEQEIGKLDEEE